MTNEPQNWKTPGQLLTVAELARAAHCSEETVRRHIWKGAIEVVRIGPSRRIRITVASARAYLGNN